MRGRERELDEELDRLIRFRWYENKKKVNDEEQW